MVGKGQASRLQVQLRKDRFQFPSTAASFCMPLEVLVGWTKKCSRNEREDLQTWIWPRLSSPGQQWRGDCRVVRPFWSRAILQCGSRRALPPYFPIQSCCIQMHIHEFVILCSANFSIAPNKDKVGSKEFASYLWLGAWLFLFSSTAALAIC